MSNSEKRMSDCLVVTEWNLPMMGYVPEYKACITSIMHSLIQIPVHGIRSFGSAAMNLTKIAEGAGDIYYEIGIHSWDIAAGILIVKEAGGVVENITSTSVDMRKRTIVAAAHSNLLFEFKSILSRSSASIEHEMLLKVISQLEPDIFEKK